jgi:hypothetical protein
MHAATAFAAGGGVVLEEPVLAVVLAAALMWDLKPAPVRVTVPHLIP